MISEEDVQSKKADLTVIQRHKLKQMNLKQFVQVGL